MSPALLKKYLEAARSVADHLVLQAERLCLRPPPGGHRDRPRQIRRPADRGLLPAAGHRSGRLFPGRLGLPPPGGAGQVEATVAEWAAQEKVSPKYLATVWTALAETPAEVGPLAKLQGMWRTCRRRLRAPGRARSGRRCWRGRQDARLRGGPAGEGGAQLAQPAAQGRGRGSQPFMLWRNAQYATHRTSFDRNALWAREDPGHREAVVLRGRVTPGPLVLQRRCRTEARPATTPTHRQRHRAHRPRFATFARSRSWRSRPDRRRGRNTRPPSPGSARSSPTPSTCRSATAPTSMPQGSTDKGRLLGAGVPQHDGVFPRRPAAVRDGPRRGRAARAGPPVAGARLRHLRPDPAARRLHLLRTGRGAEEIKGRGVRLRPLRGQGRRHRGEDRGWPSCTWRRRARACARTAATPRPCRPWRTSSRTVARTSGGSSRRGWRRSPATHGADRPSPSGPIAGRCAAAERDEPGGVLPAAAHQSRVSTTSRPCATPSPACWCRRTSATGSTSTCARAAGGAGARRRGRSDYALASRLSYFLWSSMPDEELLAHAAAGDLAPAGGAGGAGPADAEGRSGAGAGGGVRRQLARLSPLRGAQRVDRERFPSFDNGLRQAMFEEPVRYFLDIARADGSVLDFLHGKHTFVNAGPGQALRHAGARPAAEAGCGWPTPIAYGRGGLLPMAVFLTKNAPGLRTSPVKRGYWVVRRVLGEQIPPPPAEVPELPSDERRDGRPDPARGAGRAPRRTRPAPAATSASTRSAWPSRATAPSARRARATWAAGRSRPGPPSRGGSEGDGVQGLRAYLQRAPAGRLPGQLLPQAAQLRLVADAASCRTGPRSRDMRARLRSSGNRFGVPRRGASSTSPQFLTKRTGDRAGTKGQLRCVKRRVARSTSRVAPARPRLPPHLAPGGRGGDGPALAGVAAGLGGRPGPQGVRPSPSASACSSWATASTATTGRPRARARTWSSARAWPPWSRSRPR